MALEISGSETISRRGVPALLRSTPVSPSKRSWIDLPASSSRCALVMFIIFSPSSVKIFIEPKATMFLLGSEMDYSTDKLSSRFVFKNPNEKSTCGCGESFSI